jgi:hypothetical protein
MEYWVDEMLHHSNTPSNQFRYGFNQKTPQGKNQQA